MPGRVCDEFLQGLSTLGMSRDAVPSFDQLNETLMRATGWQIVAVPGLVPDEVFFDHLANRRFPASWWMRHPDQLDYLQEPDCFHDIFGHVPLLINPIFADYMEAYGKGGLKAPRQAPPDLAGRQVDLLRELLMRCTAIALKGRQQSQIEGIKRNHARLLRSQAAFCMISAN